MKMKLGIEIVIGNVDLARKPNKIEKGLPTKVTVKEVVFRNCHSSKTSSLVLERALRDLPSNLKKGNGWFIVALHPVKHLGYSVPNQSEDVGE